MNNNSINFANEIIIINTQNDKQPYFPPTLVLDIMTTTVRLSTLLVNILIYPCLIFLYLIIYLYPKIKHTTLKRVVL